MSLRRGIVAALGLLALAGCEPKVATPTCPAGKLCLHVGNMADISSVDPTQITTVQSYNVVQDMFVGLLTNDAQSKAIPGMAQSWSVSPDGLTWTFKLRDAKWSDGVPVTADDFVFAMRRLQDPKTAAEYSYLAYVVKNAEAVNTGKAPPEALGVRAIDPKTLEITLEHPAAYLTELVRHQTFFPLPAHVIRRWGDAWVQPGHIVTNGPYTLDYFRIGDRIRLVKNPRFYDAANVCLDEVYYYPTNDSVSAERRVRRGELHANVDIQSNRIAFLRKEAPEIVRVNSWLGVQYLTLNQGVPALKDARVRRALSMAIDREFITAKLLRGGQIPAYGFVPPGVANYPGGVKPEWAAQAFEQRQAEARRLLAQAGYGAKNSLKVEIKQRNTADSMLIMPAVQNDWREIGVDATLNPNESQIAYASYRVRDFEAGDPSWIADFDDAINFLELFKSTTGTMNYGDYKNPVFDGLLARADHEADGTSRGRMLAEAERLLIHDAGVIPVYFYVSKNLVRPEVTGWLENVPDWHPKRFVCFKDAAARRAAAR